MNIFYAENILETNALPHDESFHCCKVLRMRQGDDIQIIDGKGTFYNAKITFSDAKRTLIELLNEQREFGKRSYYLHLAVAPTKNIDRFEYFVEKAVEIGVDMITPLHCRFSERNKINVERVQKIIISAVKQSKKAYVPTLNPMTDFSQFITQTSETQRFIAHCYDAEKKLLSKILKPQTDTLIMIGAEGDFSIDEVETAENQGVVSVSLGNSRLRTETAGVAAANITAFINELAL